MLNKDPGITLFYRGGRNGGDYCPLFVLIKGGKYGKVQKDHGRGQT
jgi:hypothetical protein